MKFPGHAALFNSTILGLLLVTVTAWAAPIGPATYDVRFDATWSAATHPESFPPNPHFSWLIGGTHDGSIEFWAEGDPASLGIKRMAEWGSKTELANEVNAAITAGQAAEVIASDAYPVSPGMASTTFGITPAHPLVTIVSMIAPSPDWFVGVAGLDLRDGDQWVETLVVDLYPYDAGTDSGAAYTSFDFPTSPPIPVAAIPGSPFSPGVSLGTFTFTRTSAYSHAPAARALDLRIAPNPFNPMTTIAFEATVSGTVRVEIFDLLGRRVRTLLDRDMSAGPQAISWDGRNAAGSESASGVYLVRVRTADQSAVQRLTLAR